MKKNFIREIVEKYFFSERSQIIKYLFITILIERPKYKVIYIISHYICLWSNSNGATAGMAVLYPVLGATELLISP